MCRCHAKFFLKCIGDCILTPELAPFEICLFDIDPVRLREALSGAKYVIKAIQVGGYEPSTVIDFEIQKNTVCAR